LKTNLKSIIKYLLYLALLLVGFSGLFLLGESTLSKIEVKATYYKDSNYQVFVKSNGVHTDIVFPLKSDVIDWSQTFSFENTLSKRDDFQYVSIGWGDRGFYLDTPEWKDLKVSTALVAAFGIGKTLLHVTFYDDVQEDELTYSYFISKPQYEKMIKYIQKALKYQNNHPILVDTTAQYGENDAFYEAKGSYSIFHTCNTWTNNLLKEASMPSGLWVAFDKGILYHYQKSKL